MARPTRYSNADDLISNCVIKPNDHDCIIWPVSRTAPMPVLSYNSPMSRKFCTVSVARILFSICRFPPSGQRLVRHCLSPGCINPYHHSEAASTIDERLALKAPTGLLPVQESSAHLTYPTPDELAAMRPKRRQYVTILERSAVNSGFDAQKVKDRRAKYSFADLLEAHPELKAKVKYASPSKPLFVLKPRTGNAGISGETGISGTAGNNIPTSETHDDALPDLHIPRP